MLTGKHRAQRRETGQTCGRTRDTNSPINEVPCELHLARYDKVNVHESDGRQPVDLGLTTLQTLFNVCFSVVMTFPSERRLVPLTSPSCSDTHTHTHRGRVLRSQVDRIACRALEFVPVEQPSRGIDRKRRCHVHCKLQP